MTFDHDTTNSTEQADDLERRKSAYRRVIRTTWIFILGHILIAVGMGVLATHVSPHHFGMYVVSFLPFYLVGCLAAFTVMRLGSDQVFQAQPRPEDVHE